MRLGMAISWKDFSTSDVHGYHCLSYTISSIFSMNFLCVMIIMYANCIRSMESLNMNFCELQNACETFLYGSSSKCGIKSIHYMPLELKTFWTKIATRFGASCRAIYPMQWYKMQEWRMTLQRKIMGWFNLGWVAIICDMHACEGTE